MKTKQSKTEKRLVDLISEIEESDSVIQQKIIEAQSLSQSLRGQTKADMLIGEHLAFITVLKELRTLLFYLHEEKQNGSKN